MATNETAAQRRRRRARVAISQVAVRLFAEQGYSATSTEQVAAAADISRSTLFRYFPDKDDLIFALEDELLAAAAGAVRSTALDDPAPDDPAAVGALWTVLHQATLAVAEQVIALRDELLLREQVIASAPALQIRGAAKHRRWEATLARALRERQPVSEVDAALLAKLAVACFEVAQQRWLGGESASLAALLEETFARLPTLLAAG